MPTVRAPRSRTRSSGVALRRSGAPATAAAPAAPSQRRQSRRLGPADPIASMGSEGFVTARFQISLDRPDGFLAHDAFERRHVHRAVAGTPLAHGGEEEVVDLLHAGGL